MTSTTRLSTLFVLALGLIAADAGAHGGSWRGPIGTLPPARPPLERVPTPGVPTVPGGGPAITPPGVPGGVTIPAGPSGGLTIPGSTPAPRVAPNTPPTGPALSHWLYWWTLNRERILDLRGLQSRRLSARTKATTPHYFGDGDEGNVRRAGLDAARQEIFLALLEAAGDGNADVATGAIVALGKAGDPGAIPVLVKIAQNMRADETARESAVLALGMIGNPGPGTRAFLEEVARDGSRRRRTRAFAALALGFLGDLGAIPALHTRWHAKEASNEVPAAALIGMGLLRDPIVVPDLATALAGRADLRERDDILRAHAAAALGMVRSRVAVPALLLALRDRETEVRRQAALSLGAIGKPGDEEILRALAIVLGNDPDAQVRGFAAVSLGEIGSPIIGDALLYAFRKGNSVVVPYAALALGLLARNSGEPVFAEKLVPFLRRQFVEQGSTDLRGALAIALGIAGDRDSIRPLRIILSRSGDPDLRGHAAMALGLIGADEAASDMRTILKDRGNPDLQREIALALGLLGDRQAASILVEILKTASSEFTRGSAAVALGRLADYDTALALRDILADRTLPDTTRAFTAVALGLVMDQHDVPLLSRLGEHFNHRMLSSALAEVLTFL